MSRAVVAAVCALVLGCNSSPVTAPFVASSVDRIELRAWRETLGPAYPLTILRADSIATVVDFFAPNASSWRDATEFPGTPILAAILEGDQLRTEFGFVETAHGQGGFLVNRTDRHIRVRTASADDITRFLAFFGLSVEIHRD